MATSSSASSSTYTRSPDDADTADKEQQEEGYPPSFVQDLSEKCLQHGFDICEPIHTAWYNDLIEKEGHVEKGTLKKLPEPTAGIILDDQRSSTTSTSTTTTTSTSNTTREGNISSPKYNAVLISNSKFIWPFFIQWIHSRYKIQVQNFGEGDNAEKKKVLDLLLQSNPFDTFVTEKLLEIVNTCCNKQRSSSSEIVSYELFWSSGNRSKYYQCHEHMDQSSAYASTITPPAATDQYHCFESKDDSFLVSMQRVAKVTGKYWHDEKGTKLCVHPEFGTWKAFRAVVVFQSRRDAENGQNHVIPIPPPPPYCTCPVATEEINAAKTVMEYAIKVSSGSSNIDYGTATAVGDGDGGDDGGDKDQDRLCKYLHNTVTPGSDWTKVPSSMRPWIQLRDCITIGRDDYRYSDPQLLYHYTKDPDILRNELKLRERMDVL